MIGTMNSSVSGMRNHQLSMDVIGNNIANINTNGFKSGRVNFKDTLYLALGINENCQVGNGLSVANVSENSASGTIQATGRVLDVAINGNGFFGVEDESGNIKYTRDGAFYIDNDYNLVHNSGFKVLDTDGDEITLELDDGQSMEDIYITEDGKIYVSNEKPEDDEEIAQIGLFNFKNVTGLTKVGDNLYLDNSTSGESIEGVPGEDGFGSIRSGFLEKSNIDLAEELSNLIEVQRGYQANARVFTTADEVLQEIIELKR